MDRLDQVLSQVKDEYSPDAAAKQRLRAQIAASLVAGSVVTATQLAGNATAQGASATGAVGAAGLKGAATGGGWLWFKTMVGVGVFAGLGATSVHLVRSQWQETQNLETQRLEARLEAQAPQLETARIEAVRELPSARNAEPAAVTPPPSAEPSLQTVAAALPSSKRHTAEPTPASHSSMLEEFSLLRQASQALRAGNPDEARRALQEHKRRFPKSSLGPERNGLELLTSCNSGLNPGNRARAEHFLASAPSSPMAEAIRKQCLK